MTNRLRIVIADDEADIRHGFRRLLCKLNCDVVGEAADGLELVVVCLSSQPDLVITDVQMPKLSGLEAAKRIAQSQMIPVIVVSAHERPNEQELGFVTDFLLKPISGPELQAAISRACPGR
ncbi:putative transcriptional regulatory protein pdtaR [Rubripirellula amarantea]|uniref:Putative transcriptional regulatory protein pdtaR n=1 Tax=Rubripirellula amarantea TaxID=2527999 RepID=A0A5C5WGM3_9BACT|nr:response regulator [Rubripirellula amarantea]TWT49259.1 putative transcriptional regulatory protein pdtaR [Rubripirellula amarantea]